MSVWTICACFEARSEADSKKPSKQAHKCMSKKIENISRRFADCFAINFVPKWSACVNRLCRRWVLSNFDSYLLTTSYHASTFARNCFAHRASGVRARTGRWKLGLRPFPPRKAFCAAFGWRNSSNLPTARTNREIAQLAVGANVNLLNENLMRFNIERACQQIDLRDELFLRHFRRHKKKTSNENCLMILTLTFFALSFAQFTWKLIKSVPMNKISNFHATLLSSDAIFFFSRCRFRLLPGVNSEKGKTPTPDAAMNPRRSWNRRKCVGSWEKRLSPVFQDFLR